MYYRAIRLINGGETTELTHYKEIRDAYVWTKPSDQEAEVDHWHLKFLWAILEEFHVDPATTLVRVGWSEPTQVYETSVYIQKVDHYDDPLPKF